MRCRHIKCVVGAELQRITMHDSHASACVFLVLASAQVAECVMIASTQAQTQHFMLASLAL